MVFFNWPPPVGKNYLDNYLMNMIKYLVCNTYFSTYTGVEALAGGVEALAGGVEALAGGVEANAGGVEANAGGVEALAGGVEALAGSGAATFDSVPTPTG